MLVLVIPSAAPSLAVTVLPSNEMNCSTLPSPSTSATASFAFKSFQPVSLLSSR